MNEIERDLLEIENETELSQDNIADFFEGIVEIYNETLYVNTRTGLGMESVLKKMDPLINKMASKSYIPGYTFDDIKQELVIMAIQGMRSYNPSMGTRLSSFLQTHLKNKLISKLRNVNKISYDSFALHEKDDIREDNDKTKIKRIREELPYSGIVNLNQDSDSSSFENLIQDGDGLFGKSINSSSEHFEYTLDFENILKTLKNDIDADTVTIMRLIYYNDYSIGKAAEYVGLTGWAANMRLKKLMKNEKFMSAFRELIEN